MAEEVLALMRQLLLFGALLVPVEVLWPARSGQRQLRRGLGLDLAYALLSTVVVGTLGASMLAGLALGLSALVPAAVSAGLTSLPLVVQLAIVVLLAELGGYPVHRASHTVPALWRFHAVHHSTERMDWLSAHRQHPVEVLWLVGVANVPVLALGFDPSAVVGFILFQKLHTASVHANTRLPPGAWEAWFAGPRFHRWHHARDAGATNLSSLLPWIDRLLGTYRLPPGEPDALGVAEPMPDGMVGQVLHPLTAALPATSAADTEPGRSAPRSA